jgi:hypothetical protein
MKKLHIIALVVVLILSCSLSLQAQKTYTIHVGNERLSILIDTLSERNKLVEKKEEAATLFTTAMASKIDSIKRRVSKRKNFILELKKINASLLPAKLKKMEYLNLNNRLLQEAKLLAADFAYANILEKILAKAPVFKKNKKAYYAEGKFKIPILIKPKAKKVYAPIFDEIIRLGNMFEETPFQVVINSTGYSDGSFISKSSDLYEDLTIKLQSQDLSNDEMHTYLSYLRAYDASDVLSDIYKDKRKYLFKPENIIVSYKNLGKGNEVPHSENKDLPLDKRRVVYVDWYILPKY